jgi:hypothetical protein
MKFSDRFYAIGNFEKKRPGVGYVPAPCSLANQPADYLQTICNPMIGFFYVSLEIVGCGISRLVQ